ncbi:MAG: hypothetical protein Q7V01_03325, partial [Vicinamibacterales bacterium]|nr:hypothetical protein [Vicinamibacterales bacterium]
MNVDEIRAILDLVREHELAEFELEREGVKLRVKKTGAAPVVHMSGPTPYHPLPAIGLPAPPSAGPTPGPKGPAADADASADLSSVKSPIVG